MPKRMAIIGAGPVGLEAALVAREAGWDVTVYERGTVAANVGAWGFVRLFSPWKMNVTSLGLAAAGLGEGDLPMNECPTGNEFRDRYLKPVARSLGKIVREKVKVEAIGKDDLLKSDQIGKPERLNAAFRLLVRDGGGEESLAKADIVIDCSGTYGNSRWAGSGGIPAPGERAVAGRTWRTIPDVQGIERKSFEGRHTLVIGSGFSAATVLADLARLAEHNPATRVTWAVRQIGGAALSPVENDPLPLRRFLVDTVARLTAHPPAWLQFLGQCVVESFSWDEHFSVNLRCGPTTFVLNCDEVVSLVGYAPDTSIYEQLQIHQCYATQGPIKLAAALLGETGGDCFTAGAGLKADTLTNPEPGFFILGAKSYGTNSNFLMQVGYAQVRQIMSMV